MYLSISILLSALCTTVAGNCPCGWQAPGTSQLFTHQLFFDFSLYPDVNSIFNDPRASTFNQDWMVYDFWLNSDNPKIRLNTKYNTGNVFVKGQNLILKQPAYTAADMKAFNPISIAGIQTRRLDILHGTFRTTFKVQGATGGSCASFFWYHDDQTEIDIEAVTKGTSFVNNTINYTTHPSVDVSGKPIVNATRSVPLSQTLRSEIEDYHEHRFDSGPDTGVQYYKDGRLVHSDQHHTPIMGGTLQMKLWADGNLWWSGTPSTTDVFMSVKSIIAYFNTTGTQDGTDSVWFEGCRLAGGPGVKTTCDAQLATGPHQADEHPLPYVPPVLPPAATPKGTGELTPASTASPGYDPVSTYLSNGSLRIIPTVFVHLLRILGILFG